MLIVEQHTHSTVCLLRFLFHSENLLVIDRVERVCSWFLEAQRTQHTVLRCNTRIRYAHTRRTRTRCVTAHSLRNRTLLAKPLQLAVTRPNNPTCLRCTSSIRSIIIDITDDLAHASTTPICIACDCLSTPFAISYRMQIHSSTLTLYTLGTRTRHTRHASPRSLLVHPCTGRASAQSLRIVTHSSYATTVIHQSLH